VGVAQSLTGSVLDPITPTEGIEALATLLGTDRSVTGVARLRTDRALVAFPEIRGLGYFSRVVEELDATDADDGDWAGVDSLCGVEPAEAKRIITDRLCVRMAAVMGYADPTAVVTTQPLTEMGLDSLMAVRIRNTARADFGVEPPVALLLQGATLGDVAADLIGQLGLAEPSAGEPDRVRDRAQQRAAARQEAALRRKRGQRV
jgi:phthiocerol/phenolphthiocerol synthesis type-I polyketide synthase D